MIRNRILLRYFAYATPFLFIICPFTEDGESLDVLMLSR